MRAYNGGMRRALGTVRIILILCLLFAAVFISVPIAIRMDTLPYIDISQNEVPKSDLAIVLGASVINQKPSPVLAARADAAIALYQAGKVQKILVTGDSVQWSHDEVTPVRTYLVNAGIPDSRIFLDRSGLDTYSSMYRARQVFGADSVIVVTQDFHLPRALFIARHLGLRAYGFTAVQDSASPYDYVREIPASNKALWDIIVRRKPVYSDTEDSIIMKSGTSTLY